MNIRILLLFVLSTVILYTYGQTGSATADRQRILIGEPIKWHLRKTTPGDVAATSFGVDSIPRFEILDSTAVTRREAGGNTEFEQTFTITSWDSGSWSLQVPAAAGFSAEPIRIKVEWTQPFDTAQPYHDIKDIVPVEKEKQPKWHWYLIGLALLLILFLLFFPRGKKQGVTKPKQRVDPFREAIAKLEKLKAAEAGMDSRQYYTELVDIFRAYLHRRKNIYSFSKTSDDLAIQIKDLQLPQLDYAELVQTLRLSDLVKYAQFQPTAEENRFSYEVIRNTIIDIEKAHAV